MSPNDYQLACQRTECDQHKARVRIMGSHRAYNVDDVAKVTRESHTCQEWVIPTRLIHACIGITKEGGELLSLLEKWLYFGKPFTQEELRQKIKDEGGDCLYYLAELFSTVGLTFEEVMEGNVKKLAVRYPDKFTEFNAADENRNRQAEHDALNDPRR